MNDQWLQQLMQQMAQGGPPSQGGIDASLGGGSLPPSLLYGQGGPAAGGGNPQPGMHPATGTDAQGNLVLGAPTGPGNPQGMQGPSHPELQNFLMKFLQGAKGAQSGGSGGLLGGLNK